MINEVWQEPTRSLYNIFTYSSTLQQGTSSAVSATSQCVFFEAESLGRNDLIKNLLWDSLFLLLQVYWLLPSYIIHLVSSSSIRFNLFPRSVTQSWSPEPPHFYIASKIVTWAPWRNKVTLLKPSCIPRKVRQDSEACIAQTKKHLRD